MNIAHILLKYLKHIVGQDILFKANSMLMLDFVWIMSNLP